MRVIFSKSSIDLFLKSLMSLILVKILASELRSMNPYNSR